MILGTEAGSWQPGELRRRDLGGRSFKKGAVGLGVTARFFPQGTQKVQSAGRATCRLGRDLVTLCQAAFALPTVTASPWGARLGKPGSGVQLKARDLGLDSGSGSSLTQRPREPPRGSLNFPHLENVSHHLHRCRRRSREAPSEGPGGGGGFLPRRKRYPIRDLLPFGVKAGHQGPEEVGVATLFPETL